MNKHKFAPLHNKFPSKEGVMVNESREPCSYKNGCGIN
jgi:hypothetical protein